MDNVVIAYYETKKKIHRLFGLLAILTPISLFALYEFGDKQQGLMNILVTLLCISPLLFIVVRALGQAFTLSILTNNTSIRTYLKLRYKLETEEQIDEKLSSLDAIADKLYKEAEKLGSNTLEEFNGLLDTLDNELEFKEETYVIQRLKEKGMVFTKSKHCELLYQI